MQRIDRINDEEFDDILDSIGDRLNVNSDKTMKNKHSNIKTHKNIYPKKRTNTNETDEINDETGIDDVSKLINGILNEHNINDNLKKNELYQNVTSNVAINKNNLLVKKLKKDVLKNISIKD